MKLKNAAKSILDQLLDFLDQIKPDDYRMSAESLGASIGQHVRHIAEFYLCLFEGLSSNEINYDNRRRDLRIEEDRNFAYEKIREIKEKVSKISDNPDLKLRLTYGDISEDEITITTNYKRELAYNIEHTIHHLAIIKTAFREICDYVNVPENFGIASSTMRFRNLS